jgi:hypothetical protein
MNPILTIQNGRYGELTIDLREVVSINVGRMSSDSEITIRTKTGAEHAFRDSDMEPGVYETRRRWKQVIEQSMVNAAVSGMKQGVEKHEGTSNPKHQHECACDSECG